MRAFRFASYFSIVSLIALAPMMFGQSDKATIRGAVIKPGGALVPNATVQAKNTETTTIYKATSSAVGQYALTDLPPGKYDISVTVLGVKPYEHKDVAVQSAKNLDFDIKLEEGTQLSTLGEDPLAIEADRKRHAPPSGPTPRTMDGKPDMSGVWWSPAVVDPGKPEWLPNAQAVAKQRLDINGKESPQAHCLPSPVTRLGPLIELVQSKSFMVLISDDESPGFRQFYLDGRQHPKEPDTDLWYGHSIGRWEDDTLVVDRVGFNERVWLDQAAHPHSEKLHVIERYRRPDLGHLEQEVTVDDPGVLAKPWVMKRVADLAPKEEIREFICAENNRDVEHMVGK